MVAFFLLMKLSFKKIILVLLVLSPFIYYKIKPLQLFGRYSAGESSQIFFSPAIVNSIDKNSTRLTGYSKYPVMQKINVTFLDGPFKGKKLTADNYLWKYKEYNFNLKPKQKVLIEYSIDDNEIIYPIINDFYRKDKIIYSISILIVLVLLLSKKIGLKLIITIIITFFTIFFIAIPHIREGYPIHTVSLLTGIYIIITSFLLIMDFSLKSLNAILTTVITLLIIVVAAYITGNMLKITCYSMFEIIQLVNISKISGENVYILFIAGIFFSMIGAIMDVAGGISSSLQEMTIHHKDYSPVSIFKSGYNVGKDIISTELSTIFFAYTGISFVLFLTFFLLKTPFLLFINWEFITILLLFPLLSSLGIIITIPLAIILWVVLNKIKSLKFPKIFFMLFILLLFNVKTYSWDALPHRELRLHPLIEYKNNKYNYYIGKILEIKNNSNQSLCNNTFVKNQTQFLIKCKILFENKIITASRFNWGNYKGDLIINKGEYVVLERDNENNYFVINYFRLSGIIILLILNFILAIIFVHKRILYLLIIICLGFTLFYFFIFPLTINGYNPLFLSLTSLVLLFTLVIFLIYRKSKEFVIGSISFIFGISFMILVSYILIKYLNISGMFDEKIQSLKYFSDRFNEGKITNITELLISIIIVASSGALLDVIINILSTVRELIKNNPNIKLVQLKKSSSKIGFDIASTMSNTLIFIYIGTFLFSYLYLNLTVSPQYPLLNEETLNLEIITGIIIIISFIITVKFLVYLVGVLFNPKNFL